MAIMVPVFLLFLACCDVRAVLLLEERDVVVLEAVGLWACNVQISAKNLVLKKVAVGF